MVIQYENTFEEFSEASRLIALKKKKASPVKRILTVGLTIFFFYASTIFWTTYAGFDGTLVFINMVAPTVITLVVVAFAATATSLLSGKLPRIAWRTVLSFGVIALVGLEFYGMRSLTRITHQKTVAADGLDWKILMPHTGWALFLTWIMIVTFINRRKNLRALWDDQPSLHRLKTLDISAEGVVISDDKTRLQYSWLAFVGWQESKTIFLLKNSSKTALFFPKRAFPGDEELNAMRALCELIPTSTNVAFPVMTEAEPQPFAVQ